MCRIQENCCAADPSRQLSRVARWLLVESPDSWRRARGRAAEVTLHASRA
jgi:hypothetical protein